MPPGVIAAGSPAQRDPRGGQAQVSGVELFGLQPVFHRPFHPVNTGQILKRRKEGRLVDIKLPFDLNNWCGAHGRILRPAPPGVSKKNMPHPSHALYHSPMPSMIRLNSAWVRNMASSSAFSMGGSCTPRQGLRGM
jgi:hypothetical protein